MSTGQVAQTWMAGLGLELPLVQAPMAGVSSAAMAAAVSNAGALGSIGLGVLDVDGAARLIADVRARTRRAFNANVFCHGAAVRDIAREAAWLERLRPGFERLGATPPSSLSPPFASFLDDEAMLALLVQQRLPVVSFHFGLPGRPAIEALHAAGSLLMATATNLDEARRIVAAGIDVVVAQGVEAGGHRGMFDPAAIDECLGTLALTRILVRELDRPIVAAGGIMDGAGIVAALNCGASAAQLGTAFIAADESLASPAHRASLATTRTVMTATISGRPARALANELTALGEGVDARVVPAYPVAYDASRALDAAARAVSDTGFGALWAGQGAAQARAAPAAELVAWLKRGIVLCQDDDTKLCSCRLSGRFERRFRGRRN